jgi:hypothetical protein
MLFVVKGGRGQDIFDLYHALCDLQGYQRDVVLVCPVNMEKVMGAGLAKAVRDIAPAAYDIYCQAIERGDLTLRKPHLAQVDGLGDVLFFATKNKWRAKSSLSDIQKGLCTFREMLPSLQRTQFVFPPLGCGLGGLSWSEVSAVVAREIGWLLDYTFWVFLREGEDV